MGLYAIGSCGSGKQVFDATETYSSLREIGRVGLPVTASERGGPRVQGAWVTVSSLQAHCRHTAHREEGDSGVQGGGFKIKESKRN